MPRLRPTPLSLLLLVLGCGSHPAPEAELPAGPAQPPSPTARPRVPADELGRQVVRALAAGEHAAVVTRFDDATAEAMSVEQLAELWQAVQSQVGPYQGIGEVRVKPAQGHDVAIVTTRFDEAELDIRIVLDAEQRIAGLFVKPASRDDDYVAPTYADLPRIREEAVQLGDDPWILPATLTLPAERPAKGCPGLVLVHGSGPNDRDESVGPNKPFRDLALGLASRGIAVLRYDKRTHAHGEAVAATLGDALTLKEETIDDARIAAALLRSRPEVDSQRVFMLGHSLGGMALPRIASGDPALAGLIILAGSTRPLEDAVLDQMRYITELDGSLSPREKELLAKVGAEVSRVKALATDPARAPAKEQLPLNIPAPYWRDLAAHPPGPLIAKETRPILVLHGDRDYQVTAVDFAGWERALAGKPNATLTRYPSLNHLFIHGEGPSAPPEYLKPGHVDPKVIDDIARFILRP